MHALARQQQQQQLPAFLREWRGEVQFPLPTRVIQGGLDYKLDEDYPFPKGSPAARAMSKAQWREFVGDVNGRLKRSRGSSHYWLVGQILTVPFFLAARKRRSKRRGKMFHALCEEFNERFAGKLELVYSKKLDPRLQIFLAGAAEEAQGGNDSIAGVPRAAPAGEATALSKGDAVDEAGSGFGGNAWDEPDWDGQDGAFDPRGGSLI
jgi:hypothetical protein